MVTRITSNHENRWFENNPFVSLSPLKITFHSSTLVNLSPEDAEALTAIKELSAVSIGLEAIQTLPGIFFDVNFPTLEFTYNSSNPNNEFDFHIRLNNREIRQASWIGNLEVQIENFIDNANIDVDRDTVLAHTKIGLVHKALGQHILVTKSDFLLNSINQRFIPLDDVNPRTPIEAAQMIGLLLRQRQIYTYSAGFKMERSFDRGLFYWVLARQYLYSFWKYFGASVYAHYEREKLLPEDDTLELSQSILHRTVRALQARDALGKCFYSPQDNNIRDEMMYHFDYFTLLLTGVFDALARMTYRIYNLKKPKREEQVSFRREEFIKELDHTDTRQLHTVLTDQNFKAIVTMLFELRHTIHGANLNSIAVSGIANSKAGLSFISLPPKYAKVIWQSAIGLGDLKEWGLTNDHSIPMLEPYTFTSNLLLKSFPFINKIADATDVYRLFPPGSLIPTLNDKPPPNDEVWNDKILKRLAVLG